MYCRFQWNSLVPSHLLLHSFPQMLRAYLKSVAKKLAEDVDNLKTSASTLGKVCTQHEWVKG